MPSASARSAAAVTYTGTLVAGAYSGRGTLTHRARNGMVTSVYEGRFEGGARSGRGKLTVHEGDGGWIVMQGLWACDELVVAADIETSEGRVTRGCISGGQVEEFDNGRLVFSGKYKDGLRDGVGTMHHEGGGQSDAVFERGRLLRYIQYRYPCRFGTVIEGRSVREDFSTDRVICRRPLLRDAYESLRVYVAASRGKGEGLFAKIALASGEVAAFYNGQRCSQNKRMRGSGFASDAAAGIRLTHEVVDGRDWAENSNTISLDDETVLDVPLEYSRCDAYCATLGHKANHSSTPNACYDVFDHPLYGVIKCVRALQDIPPAREITVDYGFDGAHGFPDWWQQQPVVR